MQRYFGALTILLFLGLILVRVTMLRKRGIKAMHFGRTDHSDFLIVPFAFSYFYMVFGHAFGLPVPGGAELFPTSIIGWIGVLACGSGLILLYWSLVSFGNAFRVGIDQELPDKLVTTGV